MPPNQDIQKDQWTDISDFSPGAYSHDGTISTSDRLLPSPIGAHDPANTFSCIALKGGGLGALPGITHTYSYPTTFNTTGPTFVTLLLIHNELSGPNAGTECIIGVEYDFDTTAPPFKRFMNVGSLILETAAYNTIVNTNPAATYTSAPGIFGSPYPQMTRFSASNPATAPFIPAVVFPSGGPAQAVPAVGQVYVYPNISAYPITTFGPQSLITGAPNGIAGQVLVHQGRVLILCATTYTWPGTSMLFNTNDTVDFTDPST